MAIITQTILSTDEYLEVYPQDANVETDIIAGSINDATITLDAICGGMIAKVWPVEDPTDPLFRNEEEKNYIKQAHAIQAHEGVCRSVDFTGGSESYTSGSNNFNQSRTTPNIVADEIIYQLLAKARVYNPNITTDTTISGNYGGDRLWDPTYDPSQEYITIELGDNRYIHKHAESEDYKSKFLYYDENGNITYVELSEIILENFYTKEEIDAKLLAYITEAQVDAKLANYYDADEIDTKFADYYTQGQVDSKFADYYTSSQVDSLLNAKQNRLTAGQNITIAQVGQDLVISATTEPIGSVAFEDITGDPYDNAELSMVLNAKASASDLTTETLARSNADTALGNRITATEEDIEDLQDTKQNITDNTLQTTAKTIVGAINELNGRSTPTILDIYPIGSVYTTTDENFNPNTTFGGQWTKHYGFIPSNPQLYVYGNGKSLGLWDGNHRSGIIAGWSQTYDESTDAYNTAVGTVAHASTDFPDDYSLGVVPKNTSYTIQGQPSGLVGEILYELGEVYIWERTA